MSISTHKNAVPRKDDSESRKLLWLNRGDVRQRKREEERQIALQRKEEERIEAERKKAEEAARLEKEKRERELKACSFCYARSKKTETICNNCGTPFPASSVATEKPAGR